MLLIIRCSWRRQIGGRLITANWHDVTSIDPSHKPLLPLTCRYRINWDAADFLAQGAGEGADDDGDGDADDGQTPVDDEGGDQARQTLGDLEHGPGDQGGHAGGELGGVAHEAADHVGGAAGDDRGEGHVDDAPEHLAPDVGHGSVDGGEGQVGLEVVGSARDDGQDAEGDHDGDDGFEGAGREACGQVGGDEAGADAAGGAEVFGDLGEGAGLVEDGVEDGDGAEDACAEARARHDGAREGAREGPAIPGHSCGEPPEGVHGTGKVCAFGRETSTVG